MFFRLMEVVLAAFIILVLVSQILWPLFQGRPIFPFFRKQRQLEKGLAEVNQTNFESGLRKKIKNVKSK